MINSYLMLAAVRNDLSNDVALTTWAQTNFSKPITFLIGNRRAEQIKPEAYPIVILVAQPSDYTGDMQLSVGVGVFKNDLENGIKIVSEMEQAVIDALNNATSFTAQILRHIPDGNVYHPRHHMALDIAILEMLADTSQLDGFITFHADSQLDTDPEPELVTEETLPQ